MPTRRVFFIRDETGWETYFPTLTAMRARFQQHIADGDEPDTGHLDYTPTRAGVCALLNMLKQDGD